MCAHLPPFYQFIADEDDHAPLFTGNTPLTITNSPEVQDVTVGLSLPNKNVILHVRKGEIVLSKPDAKAILFQETSVYELPPAAYFFVDDLFHKSRVDLVAALTRIEAEQLPVNTREPARENRKTLGLIYGEAPEASSVAGAIPFERERESAIRWFAVHGRYGAALLSLKRTMTKFPALYLRQAYAEQLLSLYSHLELYGFLLEESNRLLVLKSSDAFHSVVKDWNETAKRKLVKLEKQ